MVGDVNNDGLVNIQDVAVLVNIIYNEPYNPAGDLNNDGIENDVGDLTLLVNLIVGNADTM